MKVSYTNIFEEPVTEAQSKSLNEYNKVFTKNSIVKKKEVYELGKLVEVFFYEDLASDWNTLEATKKDVHKNVSIIKDVQISGNYVKAEGRAYFNGVLERKTITVDDISIDDIITLQEIDINTGNPVGTEKYKYNGDEMIYSFNYDAGGNLLSVLYIDDDDEKSYPVGHDFVNAILNDPSFSFYYDASPLMP